LEDEIGTAPKKAPQCKKRSRDAEDELDFSASLSKRVCEGIDFAFYVHNSIESGSSLAPSELSNDSKEPTPFASLCFTETFSDNDMDEVEYDDTESLFDDVLIEEVIDSIEECLEEDKDLLGKQLDLERIVVGMSEETLFGKEDGISAVIGLKLAMSQFTGPKLSKGDQAIILDSKLPALGPLPFREGNFELRGRINIERRREENGRASYLAS
jgi:hypothetical protein